MSEADKRMERLMETREKLIAGMMIAQLCNCIVWVFLWVAATRIARTLDLIVPAIDNGASKIVVAQENGNVSLNRSAIVFEEIIKAAKADRDRREAERRAEPPKE